MINRDKYLSRIRSGEENVLLARVLDQAEIVLRTGIIQVTDFYDPYHAGLVISTINRIAGLGAVPGGGYRGAERVRVAIHPDYDQPSLDVYRLKYLYIRGSFRKAAVTHRDFLGALIGLGLKRQKLGDIIVVDDGAQVVAAAEVAPYIRSGLYRVGRVNVSISEITAADLKNIQQQSEEVWTTVSSMRLDAVAAAAFGKSRSKIVREIKSENLAVNWSICADPSFPVKEGDVLSARGRGRVIIASASGPLKSGRTGVLLIRLK